MVWSEIEEELESTTGSQLKWIETVGEVSYSKPKPDQSRSAPDDDDEIQLQKIFKLTKTKFTES